MVKFKKIRWKNFLSTGNAFTEIVLDKTENTLIVGENGAGKSTILDALCYGLFGKPFRNINLPTLINSINSSDLVVEVEFIIGTHLYLVRRGMKPAIFEIMKDGALINQTAKIDYQEYLENFILRWNKKTFTQVAVLGNANFVPFMQLKASDRRAIIDDILDIQIFSTMNDILKTRIADNTNKIIDNKHRTELVEQELKIKQKHVQKMREDKEKEVAQIEEEIKEKKEQLELLKAKSAKDSDYLKTTSPFVNENCKTFSNLSKKGEEYLASIIKNQKVSIDKVGFWANTSACPTCEEPISADKKKQKIKEYEDKIKDYGEAISKLRQNIKFNQDRLKEAESKLGELNVMLHENTKTQSEITMLQKFISDLTSKIKALEQRNTDVAGAEKELEKLESQISLLESDRLFLLDDLEHYEVAAAILKDKGIKARIIKQYLPIINKLVNKYLAEQDFFVNFELDEQFKEVIKSRYRDTFSYENFSEGEKQKIDMSLMLTWREVAKLKNSAATNILILDEIFDSSLDAQGVEYLMKLLHGLEKCNLFVISHKKDILVDKFKAIIEFEKMGNYSIIKHNK